VRRNHPTAVLSLVPLAGALALAGCASPPAAKAPSPPRSAAASGTQAALTAPTAGQVQIMAYSIDSDGPGFRAILTGAVGDYGPAVAVRPDGTVDPEHTGLIELKLVHGTFRLSFASVDKKIISAYRHWPGTP
jgi:hypothetical protein